MIHMYVDEYKDKQKTVCNASSKMVRGAYKAQRRAVCNGPNKDVIGGTQSSCPSEASYLPSER